MSIPIPIRVPAAPVKAPLTPVTAYVMKRTVPQTTQVIRTALRDRFIGYAFSEQAFAYDDEQYASYHRIFAIAPRQLPV